MKNAFLAEILGLKLVTLPVDGDTAQTGARVSLENAERVAFVIQCAAGVGTTLAATLKQHNDATAGTTKNLPIANAYYHKVAPATHFTKVEIDEENATATPDVSVLNTAAGVVVLEVLASDLDINGGFTHCSVDLADAGAARLVAVLAGVQNERQLPAYLNDL